MEPTSGLNDGQAPQNGCVFKWFNLLIGVAVWLSIGKEWFADDWTYCLYLSFVVLIHEPGHVIAGKLFGCTIKETQVFFLPFMTYKPKQVYEGSSWRNIKWSLGTLPLGGLTVFKSRASDDADDEYGLGAGYAGMEQTSATSPYIEDKPAWQRLLISAAGVLFNLATFLILYFAMPYMSDECSDFFWPLISLSLILALLNILPVYPLDGWAIVF